MIRALLTTAILLVGISAHADWNGKWEGQIAYESNSGYKHTYWEVVELTLTTTSLKMTMDYSGPGSEFVVDNGNLLLDINSDGTLINVGTIKDDTIAISMSYSPTPQKSCNMSYTFIRTAAGMKYMNTFTCNYGRFDYAEGTLVPRGN